MSDSNYLFEKLQRHLHSFDEHEVLLLKGHLILEQVLNEILEASVKDTEELRKMNLMFSRKIELFAALHESKGAPDETIEQLREVNRIRNRLAHDLDFAPYREPLRRWACEVVGYTPKTIQRRQTSINTIRKAFYLLSGLMAGRASVMQMVKDGRL